LSLAPLDGQRDADNIGRTIVQREHNKRLLDADMTLERLAGDEKVLRSVASTFIRTAPQLLASITAALAGRDMKRAFAQAQSLKGAVSAFEAPHVLNSVLNVERHAINEDAAAAAEALPVAQALVEGLLAEVARFASGGFQAQA
jgi:HPt (histidine-containing phosphotransfer) domain-containing protein